MNRAALQGDCPPNADLGTAADSPTPWRAHSILRSDSSRSLPMRSSSSHLVLSETAVSHRSSAVMPYAFWEVALFGPYKCLTLKGVERRLACMTRCPSDPKGILGCVLIER
jgi:hypothetical protein